MFLRTAKSRVDESEVSSRRFSSASKTDSIASFRASGAGEQKLERHVRDRQKAIDKMRRETIFLRGISGNLAFDFWAVGVASTHYPSFIVPEAGGNETTSIHEPVYCHSFDSGIKLITVPKSLEI